MTIQVPKPVAEPTTLRDPRAFVFISRMKTADGEVFGFTFLRGNPKRCAHPGCMNVLSRSNRLGWCVRHRLWRQKDASAKIPDFNKVFVPRQREQRVCKITGCNRVLCGKNRSGLCRVHYGKIVGKNHWHRIGT